MLLHDEVSKFADGCHHFVHVGVAAQIALDQCADDEVAQTTHGFVQSRAR